MEIITIVLEGTVSHKDSMGNTTKISAGEVQVMSAGTGVMHSEHNKEDSPLKLLQIWIEPRVLGIRPRYDQKQFFAADGNGKIYPKNLEEENLHFLVGPKFKQNYLWINQEAYMAIATDKIKYQPKLAN